MMWQNQIKEIVVISLSKRKDRRTKIKNEFADKFNFRFFNAISDVNGAQGIFKSYEKLLQELVERGVEMALVMEDDAEIIEPNFDFYMNYLVSTFPSDFHGIWLGVNLFQEEVLLASPGLIHLSAGWALHSVLWSLQGMKEVLKAIKKNEHCVLDTMIVKEIQSKGKCYCTLPMLMSQSSGFSDIERCHTDYKKILQQRFNEKTKHLI